MDLSSGLIAAFQSMRLAPEFRYMNMAPVDWISRIIAHIVVDPEAWGYNYHLIGQPVSLRQQIRELTLSGMAIKVMHFEDWREHFLQRMEDDPIPHLEFLALAMKNKAAVKLLEAVMDWPAGTAERVDALIEKHGLPERPNNSGQSQIQTLERLAKDGRATLPKRGDIPYLQFRETMEGSLQSISIDQSRNLTDVQSSCVFKFNLSVASFYQLFQERRVDIHGYVSCALLHEQPLSIDEGNFWVRPNDGVPLTHGLKHPLLKYKLLLRDIEGKQWWLEGMKTAKPGLNQLVQVRTLKVTIGHKGEEAKYQGTMVVPADTYIEEQIEGLEVNPNVPEQEQYVAKLIWLGWFGGQLARGFLDPLLRVGGGVLDTLRTMKDKGE
jgi:hypothetical protein